MASRQEEKEQRRLERQAAEEAEAKAASRVRLLQVVFGGILAVGLVVGVLLGTGILGGSDSKSDAGITTTKAGAEAPRAVADQKVTLPEPVETDVEKAATAAGCKLVHAKYEGAGHEEKVYKASDYATNPPTSGQHFPEWADDAVYPPGNKVELGMLVHTLEHGRVNFQYKPGTDAATVKALEQILFEKTGYHGLLYENATDMPFQFAATAWTQLLGCDTYDAKSADALRTFYDRYVDKGPEQVP